MNTVFLLKDVQPYEEPIFLGAASTLDVLLQYVEANKETLTLSENPRVGDESGVLIQEVPLGVLGSDNLDHQLRYYNWRGVRLPD